MGHQASNGKGPFDFIDRLIGLFHHSAPEQPTPCTGSTSIKTSLKMFKLQDLTKFGYLILPISEL